MGTGKSFIFILIFVMILLGVGVSAVNVMLENDSPSTVQIETVVTATPNIQNVTVIENIVVENGTYLIANVEFHLIGNIIVKNNASLAIRNAKVVLSPAGAVSGREAVILEDTAGFLAENSSITFQHQSYDESYIVVKDKAWANITASNFSGWGHILPKNDSAIYIENMSMKGPDPSSRLFSGVLSEGNSVTRIKNSTLDVAQASDQSSIYTTSSILQEVSARGNAIIEIENTILGTAQWLWGNSTLRIVNSTVNSIHFSGLTLNVAESQVLYDVWAYGHSSVWLTHVSVSRVVAEGNSTVWLIESSAGEIGTRDQGKVYVGWELPLVGTLTLSHNMLPFLQTLAFIALIVAVVALLAFLNRRWKKWQLKRDQSTSRQQTLVASHTQQHTTTPRNQIAFRESSILIYSAPFICN